jgi:hypothetical protein
MRTWAVLTSVFLSVMGMKRIGSLSSMEHGAKSKEQKNTRGNS